MHGTRPSVLGPDLPGVGLGSGSQRAQHGVDGVSCRLVVHGEAQPAGTLQRRQAAALQGCDGEGVGVGCGVSMRGLGAQGRRRTIETLHRDSPLSLLKMVSEEAALGGVAGRSWASASAPRFTGLHPATGRDM